MVNNDLTNSVQETLHRQLQLTEIIDGYTFDARVAAAPTYNTIVHNANHRIMVVRDLTETSNRDVADIVLFIKAGEASVLNSKFGPPGLTLPVIHLYWGALGIFLIN